ncbi:MAG: hypothetical protein HYW25_05365 [Candidatus Aenigmarchaeota archaeon]|nr:hypothetical protein [Candidatus Aenigmarchaeota archaeon]
MNSKLAAAIIVIIIAVVLAVAIINFGITGFASGAAAPGQSLFMNQNDPAVALAKQEFREEYSPGWENMELYEKYVDIIGANGILDVLEENSCHSEAHDLGKIIFSRSGDLEESITICGDRCTSACLHGVLMEMLEGNITQHPGDPEGHARLSDIEKEINSICNKEEITSVHSEGTCIHGLGHAIMHLSGYDINESLRVCDTLEEKPQSYYCATGAFMEYHIVYGERDLQNEGLRYPCDAFKQYPAACYRYKMQYSMPKMLAEGMSVEDISGECMKLEKLERLGCFHGIGFFFLPHIEESPARISEICIFGNSDDRRMCIEGAVEKLADYNQEKAFEACSHLDGADREICTEAASGKMYRMDKDFSLYFG